MTTTTLENSYVRTDAGRAEVRAHSLQLSRSTRNLLMVIDASCSGDGWITRVLGSTRDDLRHLLSAQLVAVHGTAVAVASTTMHQRIGVQTAVRDWTYDALYTLLTHEARERFGLIKGYRMILKIEGAVGPKGMQDVALEFVEHLRKVNGEEAAMRFRKQLGATD